MFDKTGTITRGQPRVVQLLVFVQDKSALMLARLLAVIGTAESASEHPIARAVTNFVENVCY